MAAQRVYGFSSRTHCYDSDGSYSCGARMDWASETLGMSKEEACNLVSSEFPSKCGACDPICEAMESRRVSNGPYSVNGLFTGL